MVKLQAAGKLKIILTTPTPHISKKTIRTARITKLIPLKYLDVMHMQSLRKIIPPDFSDVMITSAVGGEARDEYPANYEK